MSVRRRQRIPASGVLALLALAACSTTEPLVSDEDVRTSAVVDPAEFLGELPCLAAPGAPRSYAAILVDLDTQEDVSRSSLVPCDRRVAFERVVVDGRYGAKIEVFDQPPELAATPAWITSCGLDGVGEAVVRSRQRATVRGCGALRGPGTAQTGVSVDASAAARASEGCVSEGGPIATLDVVPLPSGPLFEPGEAATLPGVTIACGQGAAVYAADLQPGARYAFELWARSEGGELRSGAECEVVAREGIVMPAVCTPLSRAAAVVFPVDEVAEQAEVVCGSEVYAQLTLDVGATIVGPSRAGCDAPVALGPVEPGPYVGSLRLFGPGGELARASCTGSAVPGLRRPLVCTLVR